MSHYDDCNCLSPVECEYLTNKDKRPKSPVCPCCGRVVPGEDVCHQCDPKTQGWMVPCAKHEKEYWSRHRTPNNDEVF